MTIYGWLELGLGIAVLAWMGWAAHDTLADEWEAAQYDIEAGSEVVPR